MGPAGTEAIRFAGDRRIADSHFNQAGKTGRIHQNRLFDLNGHLVALRWFLSGGLLSLRSVF